MNEPQQKLLNLLSQKPSVKLSEAEILLGKKRASVAISQLVETGLVERTYALERVKVKTQTVPYIRLIISREEALVIAANLPEKSRKQQSLLNLLIFRQSGPLPVSDAKLQSNCDTATVNTLVRKDLAALENIEVRRARYPAIRSNYPSRSI